MCVKVYAFKPTKDEDTMFQLIKSQLEKEGYGAVNRFFREAILEKWERENPSSTPRKKPGRPGRRVVEEGTFHIDAPKALKEKVDAIIGSGKAANSGDALMYMAMMADRARFLQRFYGNAFCDEYAMPALQASNSHAQKLEFCEKNRVPLKEWEALIRVSARAITERTQRESMPSLDRFTQYG